jgi:hypothetical protein
MNDSLRWLLVLGCLCIVFLEAPQDLLQLFEDCGGAYPASSMVVEAKHVSPRIDGASFPAGDAVQDELAAIEVAAEVESPSASSAALTLATRARARWEEERAHEPRIERASNGADVAAGR